LELYGNWVERRTRRDRPTQPAPGLVTGTGREVGANFEQRGLVLTANYWWMKVASELIFGGGNWSAGPSGASKRHGYELIASRRPMPGLSAHAVWLWQCPADHIPGALDSVGELGVAAIFDQWNTPLRVHYVGAHA
jgi:hypothetical protein